MHVYYAGFWWESSQIFDQGESFFSPTSLYRMQHMVQARDHAKTFSTGDTNVTLAKHAIFKKWETLKPSPEKGDKTDERILAEWIVDQGGSMGIDFEGKRIVAKSRADLPPKKFSPETMGLMNGRKIPVEMPAFGKIEKLRTLSFVRLDLNLSEVKRMGEFSNLKTLVFENSPDVTDELVKEFLKHCPKVDGVMLPYTSVTDAILPELAARKITNLSLSGTKVTDKAIDILAKMPLRGLTLGETAVSEEALDRLQKAKPQLSIAYGPGQIRRK